MEPDGVEDNGHELMNRDEPYGKEKHVRPKGKKKKPKRRLSVQCQDNPHGYDGVVLGDETFVMTSSCIPDMTGYNQYISRNRLSAGAITAENRNHGVHMVALSRRRRPCI